MCVLWERRKVGQSGFAEARARARHDLMDVLCGEFGQVNFIMYNNGVQEWRWVGGIFRAIA